MQHVSRRSVLLGWLTALVAPAAAQPLTTNGSIALGAARATLPECDRQTECRFMAGVSSMTLLACFSTFDRQGRVSTGDCRNTTTTEYRCLTCGKSWTEKF